MYGNEYDLSQGCPRCGTGAPRTTALFLKASDLPKTGDLIETGMGEFLVSPLLAHVLDEEALTRLQLGEVRAARTGEPLPWFHLMASVVMPRMQPSSGGERERACGGLRPRRLLRQR